MKTSKFLLTNKPFPFEIRPQQQTARGEVHRPPALQFAGIAGPDREPDLIAAPNSEYHAPSSYKNKLFSCDKDFNKDKNAPDTGWQAGSSRQLDGHSREDLLSEAALPSPTEDTCE